MLEELPETLDETYERVLREIHKTKRGLAHRLLQCLTVAIRPLRVTELAEVLAVDFGTATSGGASKLNTDWRWEDQEQAILSTCSSLVAVVDDDGSEVVQFAHFSVKEFLASSRLAISSADVSRFHIPLEPAHTILAKACLGVLLRLVDRADGDTVETSFPLAQYAAKHWVDHAQFGNVSSYIREGMEDIFNPDKYFFSTWVVVYDIDVDLESSPLYWFSTPGNVFARPLYYAALCGFHDLAEHLIVNHGQDVNAVGGHFASPLAAALAKEHFDTAQLLYQRGADVDVQGSHKRTLLYGLSCSGHLEIARWLLNRDANPNLWDDLDNWTPLHVATLHGRLEVIRLLLHHKADKNARSKNREGEIPLHIASRSRHANIARLFLEHGVDVNILDNHHRTPLHLASRNGRFEVARLLIENGANVDAKDSEGRTAFQVARGKECKELLLEHGAEDASQGS
jgi:ankyrin repeat protein